MPATKISVTSDIAYVGMKVCRGEKWTYGTQDHVGGLPVSGEIIALNASGPDWVQVQWKGGVSQSYRISPPDLVLWEDAPIVDHHRGMRILESTVLKPGDIIMGLEDDPFKSIYYYKQGGIKSGNLYTVMGYNSSSYTGAGEHRATVRTKEANNNVWVGVSAFTMYKTAPVQAAPTTVSSPSSGMPAYLTSTTGINVGDKLIFMRHLEDSPNSDIELGEEISVVMLYSSYGIKTNKKSSWSVPIGCFIRAPKSRVEELRADLPKGAEPPYVMTPSGPRRGANAGSKKKASISSQIKTEEHVRDKINVTGRIIKLRRPSIKIERGERVRGILVQS